MSTIAHVENTHLGRILKNAPTGPDRYDVWDVRKGTREWGHPCVSSEVAAAHVRLNGKAKPFPEWAAEVNARMFVESPGTKAKVVQPYSAWPRLGQPAASNAVPVGSNLLPCTGLAPLRPASWMEWMKPSRPRDKGEQWSVVYPCSRSNENTRVYLPTFAELFDRLLLSGALSILRDWHIVTSDRKPTMSLVTFNPPKNLEENLGDGWGIVTQGRPSSKALASAERLARKLFVHVPDALHGPFRVPVFKGNNFAYRYRHSKPWRVSLAACSRVVQVRVRGNSWSLRHAYRHNGTVKHLSLGSVPVPVRNGRAAPKYPLDVTKLVLDTHDYLVRNRKAGAAKLRPFLFNGWPV